MAFIRYNVAWNIWCKWSISLNDHLFYEHQYEACKQQGIIFQIETLTPFCTLMSDPSGSLFIIFDFAIMFMERGQFGEVAE